MLFYLILGGLLLALFVIICRSLPGFVPGLPRVGTLFRSVHKIVFRQGDWFSDLAAGKIIQGALSRDPTNGTDINVLQPGLIMGKITSVVAEAPASSVIGLYAPSIIGPITVAYVASATSITVSPATAAELVRRIGTSGTFNLTGPPAAAGVVATSTFTYSAVNTSTGVITVTGIATAWILGSFIQPTDGSQTPVAFISDGYGVICTDIDNLTNLNVPFPYFPVAGVITSTQLVNWPSDPSLQAFIRNNLSTSFGGKFVFDDLL